jgi:hypothetical protein
MLPFGEIHVLEDKILHLLLEQRGQNTRGASRARGPENRDRHDIRFLRNSQKKNKPQTRTRTLTRTEKKTHRTKSNKNASSDRTNCSHK